MADFTTPVSDTNALRKNAIAVKPAITLVLAALADWLFYSQRVGISAVIFAIALICGSLLARPSGIAGHRQGPQASRSRS